MQRSNVHERRSVIVNQRNHKAVVENIASEVIFEFVLERGPEPFVRICVGDVEIDSVIHQCIQIGPKQLSLERFPGILFVILRRDPLDVHSE